MIEQGRSYVAMMQTLRFSCHNLFKHLLVMGIESFSYNKQWANRNSFTHILMHCCSYFFIIYVQNWKIYMYFLFLKVLAIYSFITRSPSMKSFFSAFAQSLHNFSCLYCWFASFMSIDVSCFPE